MLEQLQNVPPISNKTGFLIDMDGVIYRGRKPIRGAAGKFRSWNACWPKSTRSCS